MNFGFFGMAYHVCKNLLEVLFYNGNRAGLAQNWQAGSHGNTMNFIAPDMSVRNMDLTSITATNNCWLPNRLP